MGTRFQDQVVFITGASSGLGAAMAEEFAREGAQLVLAARRVDKLDEVKGRVEALGRPVLAVACDVTDRTQLDAAVAEAVGKFGGLDVVVANAGFGVSGAMTRLDTKHYRSQFETNFFGVVDTVYATLPPLRERKGRLALVSSVMGRVGLPASAPYCASKFAVTGFAESIYYDLADLGVSVTSINPGVVASEIRTLNNRGEQTGRPDPVSSWIVVPTETAARKMVGAIYRRTPEFTFTGHGVLAAFLCRHFPRSFRVLVRLFTKGRVAKIEELKRGK